MRELPRSSRANFRSLLASSSIAALLIGGGTPVAYASCPTSITADRAGCANSSTIVGITISNATISGDIVNTPTGVISATGISLTNSTVTGSIDDEGAFTGNIVIGAGSAITGTTSQFTGPLHAGILVDATGKTFSGFISNAGSVSGNSGGIGVSQSVVLFGLSSAGGGIVNSGTISTSGNVGPIGGIFDNNTSTFFGGITNSGTITADGTLAAGIIVANVTTTNFVTLKTFATFLGGLSNSGKIIASSTKTAIGIGVEGGATFGGGINNSGTISASAPNAIGVYVNGVTSFGGGITNSGTISAGTGVLILGSAIGGGIIDSGLIVGGAAVNNSTVIGDLQVVSAGNVSSKGLNLTNHATVTGSILVEGAITGGITIDSTSAIAGTTHTSGNGNTHAGILIDATGKTFNGAISNAGAIFGNSGGIDITKSVVLFGNSSTGGGIVNSGTISSSGSGEIAGIATTNTSTFQGGISNSGMITANGAVGAGIVANNINNTAGFLPAHTATFLGGISNTGTIIASGSTSGAGIIVEGFKTYTGGVFNSGQITATGPVAIGIGVDAASNFHGNIDNTTAGTITAAIGIGITNHSTINGSIFDFGLITATTGVAIDSTSEVIAASTKDAIFVDGSTFTGGIKNAGVVSGVRGIEVGSNVSRRRRRHVQRRNSHVRNGLREWHEGRHRGHQRLVVFRRHQQ